MSSCLRLAHYLHDTPNQLLLTLLLGTYMVIVCHAGGRVDLLIVLVIYAGKQPR